MESVIILGNFNMSNFFCDLTFGLNLFQLVKKPTHCRGNILDLVFTNNDNLITVLPIAGPDKLLSSDHHTISFKIKYNPKQYPNSSYKYVFDYSKADLNGLCDHLLDIDFSVCFQSDAVEHVCSYIKSVILNAMNIYIPKFRLKPSKQLCGLLQK